MKYFLHDSNAFQDEKITELFMEHGYEGIGLFFTILEKLAMQEKPIKTDVLKKQLFVGKKLDKCWKFLESSELISSNNGETFNENLLKFSEKFQIKSEKNRKRISEWRENKGVTKNVTRYTGVTERVRNTPKYKISKDNISKDNKEEASDEATLPEVEKSKEYIEKVEEQHTGPDENAIRKKATQTGGAPPGVTELVFPFDTQNFRNAWQLWLDHRARKKIPYKNLESEQMALKRLSQFDEQFSIDLIEESIERGWEGLIFKQKTKDEYEKYLKSKNNVPGNSQTGKQSGPDFADVGGALDKYFERRFGN